MKAGVPSLLEYLVPATDGLNVNLYRSRSIKLNPARLTEPSNGCELLSGKLTIGFLAGFCKSYAFLLAISILSSCSTARGESSNRFTYAGVKLGNSISLTKSEVCILKLRTVSTSASRLIVNICFAKSGLCSAAGLGLKLPIAFN